MLNLSLKELKFNIPQFRRFIQTEIGLLRGELAFLSLLDPQKGDFLSYIDLNKLSDNPGNLQAGWSFLKEPKNGLIGLEKELLSRIYKKKTPPKTVFHRLSKEFNLENPF